MLRRLKDSNARVRLQAISTLATIPSTPETRQALLEVYPDLNDPWLESAAVGVAARAPLDFIEAAAATRKPEELQDLVAQLTTQLAARQEAALAAQLLVSLASKPAGADVLKKAVVEGLAKTLKPQVVPDWSPELQQALQALLRSANPAKSANSIRIT